MKKISSLEVGEKYYSWFSFGTSVGEVELFRTIRKTIYSRYKKPLIYDLGCGTGYITNYLGAIGFDINPYAMQIARRQFPNTRFISKDITRLSLFPGGVHKQADTVVCLNVIEHISDTLRERLLSRVIPRIVKKEGLVVFSLYRSFYLPNQFNMIIKRGAPFDPTHVHNWTIDEFVQEVKKYFSVDSVRNYASYTKFTNFTRYLKNETLVIAKLKNRSM
jgi:SAM-dependent methyltransferase